MSFFVGIVAVRVRFMILKKLILVIQCHAALRGSVCPKAGAFPFKSAPKDVKIYF